MLLAVFYARARMQNKRFLEFIACETIPGLRE
jgi:hypothetical protein